MCTYKRFILMVGLIITSFVSKAQTIDIPNPNFLSFLLNQGIDLNEDGLIQMDEALLLDSIRINTFFDNFNDIQGIEYFTNLRHLNVFDEELSSINLSTLTKLEYLNLGKNNIDTLDCSNNIALEYLNCSSNQMKLLTLPNSSSLIEIHANANKLEAFDFTGMNQLIKVNCADNLIDTVSVIGCTALEYLNLKYNTVSHSPLEGSLNLTDCVSLKWLNARQRTLGTLDLSNNPLLEHLDIRYSRLNELNLENNPLLQHLDISTGLSQTFTSIDLSHNPQLSYLFAELFELTDLDVSLNPLIDTLYIRRNQLTSLDISNQTELKVLEFGFNQIAQLDISNNPELIKLECYQNQLNEIDLSNNTKLEDLRIHRNNISHLDLSNNPQLDLLNCEENKIEILDLTMNQNLTLVYAEENELDIILAQNGTYQSINAINNPNLTTVCLDEEDFLSLNFNQTVVLNGFCNFLTNPNFSTLITETSFIEPGDNCGSALNLIDVPVKFHIEEINSGQSFCTIHESEFESYLPIGDYRVVPIIENPELFEIVPPEINLSVEEIGDTLYSEFCIYPSSIVKHDAYIYLLPLEEARAGFDIDYKVIIGNKGNTSVSGMIFVEFPNEIMSFLDNTSIWTVNDDQISTEFSELLPFEEREYNITFKLNSPQDTPPLDGGELLNFEAEIITIEEDCDIKNNNALLEQITVNAFDPNDKKSLLGRFILMDSFDQKLLYQIRFENTGTASAQNILVKDTLDFNFLDPTSVQLIDASHNTFVEIRNNIVEFVFEDIFLPFEEDNNQGHIVFEIDTKPNYQVGDTVSNNAAIFFDFNFPVITNDAKVILVEDVDKDGFNHLEDCDDNNEFVNPAMAEIPYNGLDDDCDLNTFDDDLDQDGFVLAEDCNDEDSDIHPNATEICGDGIDQNCDNNDLESTFYADNDGDGFGDLNQLIVACNVPNNYVANSLDCDDANANISPSAVEIDYNGIDDDCNPNTLDDDLDQDGFTLSEDCDDNNPNINPSQIEIPYNGLDDDCNDETRDDDLDQDGFVLAEDCDDNDPNVNPAVEEITYNGVDDDCNSETLDDDLDQDGFILAEDCDDNNTNVNPAVEEITYNGIDDDCNSDTLDDDLDQDGFTLADDCDDNNPSINPSSEEIIYNGLDDDCNSETLDDDLDQDGFILEEDCDDNNAEINPSAVEIPYNGLDDDCNEMSLDDDLDQDGFLLEDDCDDTNDEINPDANEIPNNGIDEDCDGEDLSTSVFELANVRMNIFPNPVSEDINIKVSDTFNYRVEIFELNGKLIHSSKNTHRLKMNSLYRGTYLLKVTDLNSEHYILEKLVKI